MLFEQIERLRAKPVHVRKKYTLLYSLGLTGLIVVIWLTSLFAGRTPAEDILAEQDTSPARASLFEAMTAEPKSPFDNNTANALFGDAAARTVPSAPLIESATSTDLATTSPDALASTTQPVMIDTSSTSTTTSETPSVPPSGEVGDPGFVEDILHNPEQ
jgi:hypothetical protein